jgi:hypothetical protein
MHSETNVSFCAFLTASKNKWLSRVFISRTTKELLSLSKML